MPQVSVSMSDQYTKFKMFLAYVSCLCFLPDPSYWVSRPLDAESQAMPLNPLKPVGHARLVRLPGD